MQKNKRRVAGPFGLLALLALFAALLTGGPAQADEGAPNLAAQSRPLHAGVLLAPSADVPKVPEPGKTYTPPNRQAAVSDCRNATGPTYGAWSGSQSYTYTRTNNWCMHNPWRGHEHWRLVFQNNGDLVLYDRETVRWRTYTSGTRLVFQTDGNMVIYNANGSVGWAFNVLTSGVGPNTIYRLEWYFNSPQFHFGAYIRQTNPNFDRYDGIHP